ncbi:hypothetical protein WJX81_007979 [Elliptochloris bilobata]|uniref:Uncharacterized protein n=1 Tax=Elliptochloris bilobata TaxID=381761 RepID=A0AAW1QXE7_9CHLO
MPASCTAEPGKAAAVQELLKDMDDLLAMLPKTHGTPMREETKAELDDDPPSMVLQCDVNGCTIVPVASTQASPRSLAGSLVGAVASKAAREWHGGEGTGWTLGCDRSADPSAFGGLVGGEGWTAAVTRGEYDDFVRLLRNLRQGVQTLHVCGDWAATDDAVLDMDTDLVWVQGRALRKRISALQELWQRTGGRGGPAPAAAFSLRFRFKAGGHREVEGTWSDEAVAQVLSFLEGGVGP